MLSAPTTVPLPSFFVRRIYPHSRAYFLAYLSPPVSITLLLVPTASSLALRLLSLLLLPTQILASGLESSLHTRIFSDRLKLSGQPTGPGLSPVTSLRLSLQCAHSLAPASSDTASSCDNKHLEA